MAKCFKQCILLCSPYAVQIENIENKLAVISHGNSEVTTAIYKDKILGVQFIQVNITRIKIMNNY